MAYDIGPRIGIEGEAEFRKQIQSITTVQKTLATEMQAVTSAFDKNDQSQENLTAQNKVLTKQIDAQKQKLDLLRDGLAAAAEKYGENDKVTQGWQQAVNKATADLNKMERQLQGNNDVLSKVDDVTDDASDGIDDFKKSVIDASDESLKFSDVLKANLLSQVIIDGVKRLASAAKDMVGDFIESAAGVKAETSQFEQTFGNMASTAEAAVKRVADASGIMETRLNGTASSIYAFARSSGADSAEAMSLMETALQAAADSAAYYDKSLEDTSDTLMSFLKGNYANDAALGVSATETTRNAKATELFGKKYNDLSEIQKQQTLLKMVTDSQKLSGAMGQASREADGWENVQGNLNETWRQFQAQVGTPLLENLVPIIQGITTGFQDWMKSIDIDKLSEMVTGFFTFVKENGALIVSAIAGIGTAFLTWNSAQLISGAVTAFQGLKTAISGATTAQELFNLVMGANPMAKIVTIVMAVVAAVIVLWNTNEDFRNAIIGIWENVKATISGVVDALVGFFTKTLPDAWNNLGTFFTTEVPKIVQSIIDWFNQLPEKIGYAIGAVLAGIVNFGANTWTWITTQLPLIIAGVVSWFAQLPGKVAAQFALVIANAVKWAQNMVKTAATEVPKFVSKVVGYIGELPGKMLSIGTNIVRGIWDGINGAIDWLKDRIAGFCSSIVSGFKKNLEIHSPSRIFADEIGKNVALGIGVGFEDNIKTISAQMSGAVRDIAESMSIPVNVNTTSSAIKGVSRQFETVETIPQYLNLTLVTPDGVTLGKYVAPFVGKALEINARNLSPARG
nr:MAG TPA: hypothetical protein [Caudoviricetes sp.]